MIIIIVVSKQVHEHRSRHTVHPTVARRPRSSLSDGPQSPSPSPSPASPHVADGPSPSRHSGLLKQIPRFVLRPLRGGGGGGRMEVAHRRPTVVATDSNYYSCHGPVIMTSTITPNFVKFFHVSVVIYILWSYISYFIERPLSITLYIGTVRNISAVQRASRPAK